MPNRRSIDFLPAIFNTETNNKFLNATLDQLISEPNFLKVNGYIGRKFSPTYKSTDSYINEASSLRQSYQLEPGVVVTNTSNEIEFFGSYIDLLQKIEFYGGDTTNQSRLFAGESYSYNGLYDFDKFVNFAQYYWLQDGPDPVYVYAGGIPTRETFTVTRDTVNKAYYFTTYNNVQNPTVNLVRGGVYEFVVNQPGVKFWIQSEPGADGLVKGQVNTSSRDVFGVTNNGVDVGTITFAVPQLSSQSKLSSLVTKLNVDLATDISFSKLANRPVSEIISKYNGIDGIKGNLNGKKVIFLDTTDDASFWQENDIFDFIGMDSEPFDSVSVISADLRRAVWTINVVTEDDGNEIVTFVNPVTLDYTKDKVFVRSGITKANKEFYISASDWVELANITAPSVYLYYQDGDVESIVGEFKIVEPTSNTIDIEAEVLGKKYYVSPNGVSFTNGLKVTFDTTVVPSIYANKTYYVEGVGRSIRLVDVDQIVVPESYTDLTTQDYLTINRGSLDVNAWSRSNRWFHVDVINAVAEYNDTIPSIDQTLRAKRPIIEFNSDLQLFNYGTVGKGFVDILELSTITNAFAQVEGQPGVKHSSGGIELYRDTTFTVNGITFNFRHGDRVIFAADTDPTVVNTVYTVNILDTSADPAHPRYITVLRAENETNISVNHNLLAKRILDGTKEYLAKTYWYTGYSWVPTQEKTAVNQAPLFDVVDSVGVSIGDTTKYINSSFAGTKIFSYKEGTGTKDTVLGFPLSYRNFNNVGDILFDNNYDSEEFTYQEPYVGVVTKKINYNNLKENTGLTTYKNRNVWSKVNEQSKQYQLFEYTFTGKSNYFEIDIEPAQPENVPTIFVYINNNEVSSQYYQVVTVGARRAVRINVRLLAAGDAIDIRVYSNSISNIGFFEVPYNLARNTLNANFTDLTLGQLRNHLIEQSHENVNVVGPVPGASNLRDVNIDSQTGRILQHASPLVYSNLFLLDENLNFIKGTEYAQKEYTRFKNKFLETAINVDYIDTDNIPETVTKILQSLNRVKNSTFPWYYSDMVPYGTDCTPLTYIVNDPQDRRYEISTIFNDTVLGNRAVLVYYFETEKDQYGNIVVDANNNPIIKSRRQLIKDRDFVFEQDRPSIKLTTSTVQLFNDIIYICDYTNTDGNYIPETPTKLGLYPKFVPTKFVDNTYSEPTLVVQGHDGSITPAFNDYRDDLLIELESRIYNNIKVNYATSIFDIYDYFPGKFRNTEYNRDEFNKVLGRSFLKWVGFNRVDFTNNNYFDSNNPWTWNYKFFTDTIDGSKLQGAWRSIYNYFYDTDRPHTHPWEMLGFSEQPDWWQDRYGPAPYTGGNLVLWGDLEAGYIHAGTRAGIDARFARPGLTKIIPVDDSGNLKSPNAVMVAQFDSVKANASFAFGDQGPVETAWRRSSDYPYAVQIALALTKPAFYFGSLINTHNYYRRTDIDQYVLKSNSQRLTPADVKVNGQNVVGINRTSGYINWVADYLTSLGIDPVSKIEGYLANINVQLAYKIGGYTDYNYIKVLAEQSSPTSTNESVIIPSENYRIHLAKSVPVKRITYSGVIIERSENGYTVSGYDQENPYFTIIPSRANNNATKIDVNGQIGIIYEDFEDYKVRVPYGFEFNTRQQVVDFLVSYGRFLAGSGFVFDQYSATLGERQDWVLSAKEFLTWAQQGWKQGNVITLSPIIGSLKVRSDINNAVVDKIENSANGSKILDPNFNIIKSAQFTVTRFDNTFTLNTLLGQTIAMAQLNLVQYEHVLVFDNTTVFNDIIYKPELGNRQYRLKLIGSKTGGWTGNLNPPGFIYNNDVIAEWQAGVDYRKGSLVSYKDNYFTALANIDATDAFTPSLWKQVSKDQIKTGLLPNFAFNAQEFENVYDIDNQPNNSELNKFSNGLIGFRERQYMSDLGIDVPTQAKFYQGYIKQKGTLNAVNALTSANLSNLSSEIELFEEWGVRVGEYGSVDSNEYVDVTLDDKNFASNPSTFALINYSESVPNQINSIDPGELYRRPNSYDPHLFATSYNQVYSSAPKTAGYVNLNDVDATIFDITNYADLNEQIDNIGSGFTIWVAKDFDKNWNVYRVSETNNYVTQMGYVLDDTISFTTELPHGLVTGDLVAVRGFDSRFDGFYQVSSINGLQGFYAVNATVSTALAKVGAMTSKGVLFKTHSARMSTVAGITTQRPLNGWKVGETIWVDNYDGSNHWGVLKKYEVWNTGVNLPMNESDYISNSNYGSSVKLSTNGLIAVVGQPNNGTGVIKSFVKNPATDTFFQSTTISPNSTEISGFGTCIDMSDSVVVVGAPDTLSHRGMVFVYNYLPGAGANLTQSIILPAGQAGDRFGHSVSISKDNQWLYVGAPEIETVYAYALKTLANQSHIIQTQVGFYAQQGFTVSIEVINHGYQTGDSLNIDYISGLGVSGTFTVTVTSENTFTYEATLSQTTSGDVSVRQSSNYLSFTPDSTESIVVAGNYKTYIPYIDYTVTGNTIDFTVDPGDDALNVTQGSYYVQVAELTAGTEYDGKFGSVVKSTTDGRQVIIGSPYANINNNINSGVVIVYDRLTESFLADGFTNTFTLRRVLGDTYKVLLNGNELTSAEYSISVDTSNPLQDIYTVRLNQTPIGGAIIEVEVNEFNLASVIGSEQSIANSYFGSDIDVCFDGCTVVVGAPNYSRDDYFAGRVYRYVNQSAEYGLIVGVTPNPAPVAGDSIRISGKEVIFSSIADEYGNPLGIGNVDSVVDDINGAGIPGVIASNIDGFLKLESNSVIAGKKLTVLPGQGTALFDLGLMVYEFTQAIEHPYQTQGEYFGSKVQLSEDANTVLISSTGATTITPAVMDQNVIKFDSGTTSFIDKLLGAGAVSVFDKVAQPTDSIYTPALYTFNSQLKPQHSVGVSSFGSALSFSNNITLVGASTSDSTLADAGEVYVFVNSSKDIGWQVISTEAPKVKVENLLRMFVYNKKKNEIQTNLDYIDPAKGKILGIAEQELDFISTYDPARYNVSTFTPTVAINYNSPWGKEHVGEYWWNVDAVRYVDYEQGDLVYRSKNWASMFPGSDIEICEWVESTVLPSQYVDNGGSGTPKHADDSAYVVTNTVNPTTGIVDVRYYFWVKNKNTVNGLLRGKTKSTQEVANIIANPESQGVPYAAVIADNAFNLYNVNSFVDSTNTALRISYSVTPNENIIHSEYHLVQQGNPNSHAPAKIIAKAIDSLAGVTVDGYPLPDPGLPESQKYGIGYRPRQAMFKDRISALKNIVTHINNVFMQYPIALEFNIQGLYAEQSPPTVDSGEYDQVVPLYDDLLYIDTTTFPIGYKILVQSDTNNDGLWSIWELGADGTFSLVKIQRYKTGIYIEKADWYDSSFDPTSATSYTVDTLNDVQKILTLSAGETIKVKNNGSGLFAYYIVNESGSLDLIGLENGTIQVSSAVYDYASNGLSFDSGNFDGVRFDQLPSDEIRIIATTVLSSIFIKNLSGEANKLFFALVNYLLTEQPTVDWLFKTSFISVLHKIRQLAQYPSYIKDNQTYFDSYIDEVKPYRTQIREYLLNYTGDDTFAGNVTDFDLPGYYDSNSGTYRSPTTSTEDANILLKSPYNSWNNNYKYSVSSIEVANPGVYYTQPPAVTISGGGGTGATAEAILNLSDGSITSIVVLTPGSGYTSTPTVTINGDGAKNNGAEVVASVFGNGAIDSFSIINPGLEFENVPYVYIRGTGTSAQAVAKLDSHGKLVSVDLFEANVETSPGVFELTPKRGTGYDANVEIVVADPLTDATAVAHLKNIYFKTDASKSYNTVRSISSTIKFDRVSYETDVIQWQNNQTYYVDDVVSYNNKAYRALETVVPTATVTLSKAVTLPAGTMVTTPPLAGNVTLQTDCNSALMYVEDTQGEISKGPSSWLYTDDGNGTTANLKVYVKDIKYTFDLSKYELISPSNFETANDRVAAYYAPKVGMPPKDSARVFDGIDYPGVQVRSPKFDEAITSITSGNIQIFGANSTLHSSNVSLTNFVKASLENGQKITITSTPNPYLSPIATIGNVTITNGDDMLQLSFRDVIEATSTSYAVSPMSYEYKHGEEEKVAIYVDGQYIQPTWVDSFTGTNYNYNFYGNSTIIFDQTSGNVNITPGSIIEVIHDQFTITDKFEIGQAVSGTGIPENARIKSVVQENLQIVLTEAATATTANTTIGIYENNWGTYTVSSVKDNEISVYGPVLYDETPTTITFEYYNENNPLFVDSQIQSTYTDSALGTRPEDINLDGGGYVDRFSSHAPEELIPGRVFDNLNMEVYTLMYSGSANVGYRISHGMKTDSSLAINPDIASNELWPEYFAIRSANTTVLASNLSVTDTSIYVEDARLLTNPSKELGRPGVIYINGEKIYYYRNYAHEVQPWFANVAYSHDAIVSYQGNTYVAANVTANVSGVAWNFANVTLFNPHVLTQLRRGVDGTGIAMVHAVNSRVVDSGDNLKLPNEGGKVHTHSWLGEVGPNNLLIAADGDILGDFEGNSLFTGEVLPGAITDGTGLEGSNTPQARFIKGYVDDFPTPTPLAPNPSTDPLVDDTKTGANRNNVK